MLTAFGETDGVAALCDAVDLPDEAYYLWPPQMEAILSKHYERPNAKREWRMVLEPERFAAPDRAGVRRIQPDQAEELAHDAFVKAFTGLEGFRGDASFRTWVLGIAANVDDAQWNTCAAGGAPRLPPHRETGGAAMFRIEHGRAGFRHRIAHATYRRSTRRCMK